MKKIIYLLILPALAFTLSGEKKAKIKGHIKLTNPVDWIYMMYHTPDGWVRDSAKVINDEFRFEKEIQNPMLADLWIKGPKRESVSLFLEQGDMTVRIKDSLKAMIVSGSKAHEEYLKLQEVLKPYEARYSEVSKKFAEFRKTKNEEGVEKANAEWSAISEEINQKIYLPYIQKNPKSPIAVYVVEKYTGSWYDIKLERIEKAEKVLAMVSPEVKEWPAAKDLARRLTAAKNTSPGATAMDFTLKDSTGNDVSLSSFRGKYVLIDFWASWCVPCRANNPHLVKAYRAFNEKGFTILGVAFDGGEKLEKAWRVAMVTDGLPWVNVNDVKYPDVESVGRRYNVGSIPQNVLVDPTGKIIAKNIEGEDLSKKLTELLGDANAQSGKSQ